MSHFDDDRIDYTDGQESGPAPEKKDPAAAILRELFDWAEALVVSLTVIVIAFTFFAKLTGVEGDSMYPTLHNQDRILITHFFYNDPEPGDIVVLRKQSFMEEPIVKRVIATAGQTVDINFATHEVSVDGKVLYEPYINEPTALNGDLSFPCKVPEGSVFVMGDNRNHSSDSRLRQLGMVDKRYILGKLILRVFPFNRIGTVS